MKIRFLKKHLNWKQDEETEVDEARGKYLLQCSVAESADSDPEKTEEILMNHLKENVAEVKAGDMSIDANFPEASQLFQEPPKPKKAKAKNK